MSFRKDLSEMLQAKNICLNNDLIVKFENLSLESKSEIQEFPKLRKPKADTMLKVQQGNLTDQKNVQTAVWKECGAAKNVENFAEINISNVPLGQEFLNKKEVMKKTTSNIMKKYDLGKTKEQFLDEEPQPITIKDIDITSSQTETTKPINILNTSKLLKNNSESMNYNECHLINILHIKIKAHPNGFFANNIPSWYKTTFDKILPTNWLDIVKKSNKFSLENINTKIVLYAVEDGCDNNDDDSYASGDMVYNKKYDSTDKKDTDKKDTATGFVRFKHLEKSLHRFNYNAGRDVSFKTCEQPMKLSDKFYKPNLSKSNLTKSNVRYKHLQGPWSNK